MPNKLLLLRNYFSKNVQISNVMKIRPEGYELFHANGWTDRYDDANSRVSQFCVRPKQKGGKEVWNEDVRKEAENKERQKKDE
jgi:hypothetical protein